MPDCHGGDVTLARLAAGLEVELPAGADDLPITGLADDSRRVQPGNLFAAIHGTNTDGHQFIAQACAAGARAVLVDRPVNAPVPIVHADDTRVALARLAARFHGIEDALTHGNLRLIGITGTNGKSTTAILVQAMLHRAGHCGALIGTIEHDLVSRRAKSEMTTPSALELTAMLAEAHRAGADFAVLEVSSHALDQRRTDGLRFSAAVFTNLTGDHLDYHGTTDEYRAAKRRLFDALPADAAALINADDPAAEAMTAACPARIQTYGQSPAATLRAEILELSAAGTTFAIHTPDARHTVRTPLVGTHNVYNALAACGAARAVGLDLQPILTVLESPPPIPGRLERISAPAAPVDVFVDYAHTDDALRNVLAAARRICRGRLIALFGCGGNRDTSKRPRMARAAIELADLVVVTSDNPRQEDPQAIINDILRGFDRTEMKWVSVQPDRRAAIELALRLARPADVLIIAGKGHEDYQIVGTEKRWFDDRVVARELLTEIHGEGT